MSSPLTTAARTIYAADVGSTRTDRKRASESGFGWARQRSDGEIEGGRDIAELAAEVADDLRAGYAVALGFEAPLAIPVPVDAGMLCRGRAGEGNRSCTAPVGLAVSALGLHQAAWILAEIRAALGPGATTVPFAHVAAEWPVAGPTLFCWEAFVSGPAHSEDHIRDAATAVRAFLAAEADLAAATVVRAERPLSLIAAAALWSGWITDPAALHTQTAVIRPATAYSGAIRPGRCAPREGTRPGVARGFV
jgi:hypothetical protein